MTASCVKWKREGFYTLAEARTIHHWLAAGLGSGWLPKAPGTWGSLASLLPAWLIIEQLGVLALLLGSLLLLIVGCWNCYVVLPTLKDKDPGWIVIDEWAGQWLCLGLILLVLDYSVMLAVALSFIGFRGFDILKPWPISRIETMGPPWWSIMADDIVAGLIGATVVIGCTLMLGL